MIRGKPAAWAAHLKSLDVRFLRRVVAVWPDCLLVLPNQPQEDDITFNLVARFLRKDRHVRKWFHWVAFQYHPPGYEPNGLAYSKGRIDMAVLLDPQAEGYLAYECKCLNKLRDDGRRSLAGEYVREGLSRFVAEQYAENLPVGCMLGYVLDGDVPYAASSVRSKIIACARKTALIGEPRDETAVGVATRFSSRHRRRRSDSEIEIRHALLPVRQRNDGLSANRTGSAKSARNSGRNGEALPEAQEAQRKVAVRQGFEPWEEVYASSTV